MVGPSAKADIGLPCQPAVPRDPKSQLPVSRQSSRKDVRPASVVQRIYVNWPYFSQLVNGRRLLSTNVGRSDLSVDQDVTFQTLRHTFATQVHGNDAQTQLRHSNPTTTMNVCTQEIPSSVKAKVEALDQKLFGVFQQFVCHRAFPPLWAQSL